MLFFPYYHVRTENVSRTFQGTTGKKNHEQRAEYFMVVRETFPLLPRNFSWVKNAFGTVLFAHDR
jgi:hypothetical protein